MSKIEIKKPWYIPAFVWNRGIDMAANAVKSAMKPDNLAQIVATNEAKLLRRAIKDRDPQAVARVTRVCKQVANHAKVVTEALEDGIITPEEETALRDDIIQTATGYITEAEINAKIDELAKDVKA